MEYLTLALLTLAGIAVYDGHPDRRGRMAAYWGLCAVMTLLAGLRFRVGIDTVMYEVETQNIPPLTDFDGDTLSLTRFEPGFVALSGFCNLFAAPMLVMQMILAVWINVSVFRFGLVSRKEAGERIFLYAGLYLLLVWLPFNFEIIRQGAAISFLLWGLPLLERRRYAVYALLTLCAVMMHYSAIVMAIVPLLTAGRERLQHVGWSRLALLAAGAFATGYLLRFFLFSVLPDSPWTPTVIASKLRSYIIDPYSMPPLNWRGIAGILLKTSVYPAVAMYLLRRNDPLVWTAVLLALLSMGFHPVLRFYYWFLPSCLVVMAGGARALERLLPSWSVVLAFVPLVVIVLWGYMGNVRWSDGMERPSYRHYIPYHSWLDQTTDTLRCKTYIELIGVFKGTAYKRLGFDTRELPEEAGGPESVEQEGGEM